ncbi:Tubulin-tyrosine ligase family [Popillia japonica]|uniref:Tubulin-tyrosine ligase family n=1 Tax=Popillia japonica TaxID=7064 RepID=A0AAW1KQ41_POPJA
MTIYLYKEGLVRFGTDKFTLNDLENPFRHLTNTAINKLSPGYAEMKENVGSGCKWTFSQLRRYFQQIDVADWLLWQKISVLVILTVLSQAKYIPSSANCFEFLGFDVLVDNRLKPWLLEVNLSPALGNDCDVDRLVKKPMLHDMFDLLGLPLSNMSWSIHNYCCDESEENPRNCITPVLSIKSSVVLIHAADRWRKKHRKMSAKQPLKNKFQDTKNLRAPSAKEKSSYKHVFLHKPDVFPEALTETQIINRPVDKKLSNTSNKWGNGRDWKNAPPHEGKWVRIWPMNLGANYDATHTSDKAIVLEMIKFHKIARDIYKKYPTASECQLNDYLQVEMNMSREIWIPPL